MKIHYLSFCRGLLNNLKILSVSKNLCDTERCLQIGQIQNFINFQQTLLTHQTYKCTKRRLTCIFTYIMRNSFFIDGWIDIRARVILTSILTLLVSIPKPTIAARIAMSLYTHFNRNSH